MNEGPRGLFAGYQSFLLRDLPFDAIEFLAYEQLKVAYTRFLKGERAISPVETSVIGAKGCAQYSLYLCFIGLEAVWKPMQPGGAPR